MMAGTLGRYPNTLLLGVGAAAGATVLWIIEQLTDSMIFEILTIPVKLLLLAVFPLFLSDLSRLLHGRYAVALCFLVIAVGVTVAAAVMYLPWRDAFCARYGNDVYRWYYAGSRPSGGLHIPPGDLSIWIAKWQSFGPHLIEFGILLGFYAIIIGGCTSMQLRRPAGLVLGLIAYAYLLVVPLSFGIVVLDYDFFLKGIAFDSISLDFFPISFWKGWDFSVFLYAFMLIFFLVSAFFFYVRPQPKTC